MTFKHTKSKGYSIVTENAELLLGENKLTVVREQDSKNHGDYVVDQPGEYDVAQVAIFADYPSQVQTDSKNQQATKDSSLAADQLVYLIEAEGFAIGYLSTTPGSMDDKLLPEFETVDLLLVPGSAHQVVNQLAPPLVIPLSDNKKSANKLGLELPEPVKSFTINSSSNLPEETELVNLRA